MIKYKWLVLLAWTAIPAFADDSLSSAGSSRLEHTTAAPAAIPEQPSVLPAVALYDPTNYSLSVADDNTDLNLQAIVVNGGSRYCVINNQILGVDDKIGNMTITEIGASKAQLVKDKDPRSINLTLY